MNDFVIDLLAGMRAEVEAVLQGAPHKKVSAPADFVFPEDGPGWLLFVD